MSSGLHRRLAQLNSALHRVLAAGGRRCISAEEQSLVESFLSAESFAVVGASRNRSKFGNQILRCYLQHDKPVTPVSIKETDVERVRAVKALHELGGDVAAVGVSVITPPPVTLDLLDDIAELGISKVWLQPGAESPEVVAKCADLGINALHAVDGAGPCLLIELGYDDTIVYSTTERLTRRTQVLR